MIEQLYPFLEQYIHLPYLVVFVLLTYGLKDVATLVTRNLTGVNVPTKYAVFIFATLLAAPFWFYVDPLRLLVTYAVGTSFYDLIIEATVDGIKNWINKKRNG